MLNHAFLTFVIMVAYWYILEANTIMKLVIIVHMVHVLLGWK